MEEMGDAPGNGQRVPIIYSLITSICISAYWIQGPLIKDELNE
jgi:hypothetical protein